MHRYNIHRKSHSQKLLELINESDNKVSRHKINMQISIIFLCTSKEQSENEINKLPFAIATKEIKKLETNLNKEMQVQMERSSADTIW